MTMVFSQVDESYPPSAREPIPGQHDLVQNVIALFPCPGRLLDIGAGNCLASHAFVEAGAAVTATGFDAEAYLKDPADRASLEFIDNVDVCDMGCFSQASFDAVWCAHVLEHTLDSGQALQEILRVLEPGGRLFLSVPPFKHEVVGGHVTPGWNLGILMYVLAVAGFDLSDGRFVKHGYNVFAAVRKPSRPLPDPGLHFANGDLERLTAQGRFPEGFEAQQSFEGNINHWNWEWRIEPTLSPSTPRNIGDKLTIALFVPWITKGKGGTEIMGAMVANGMAERGHRVHVHTFDDRQDPPTQSLGDDITVTQHAEQATEAADKQLLLDLALQQPDVIVGFYMNRFCIRYVYCGYKLGVPVLLSEHNDPASTDEQGTLSRDERESILACADTIHLLTDGVRDGLPTYLANRTTVIPNTVPSARVPADPKGGGEDATKTVLCVAEQVPRKHVRTLISAFAKATHCRRDWRLQVAGYGSQPEGLEALATRLAVSDRVSIERRQSDIYRYYEEAQLVCLPSSFEPLPLVPIEAMAHGLPSVAFDDCPVALELIENEGTGLLVSHERKVDSLAEALGQLMDDPDLRAAMGAAGKARYDDRFAMRGVVDRWDALIRYTAAKPPRTKRLSNIGEELRRHVMMQRPLMRGPAHYQAPEN